MVRTFIWEGLDIVWGERKQPVEVEMPESRRECIMGTFPIHYGTLLLKYIYICSTIGNILTCNSL